jgi:hypothetical protein
VIKRRILLALLVPLAWLSSSRAVFAEIFKLAIPTDRGIELYWWPQLRAPEGWVHDEDTSRSAGSNIFVPNGQSFSEAPAVMYGRALYKPYIPETRSLDELISDDKRDFQKHFPGVSIQRLPDLKTGASRSLRRFSYSPFRSASVAQGSWEQTAYGEEGDFYLIFVVSAHTEAALRRALPAFYGLIANYK